MHIKTHLVNGTTIAEIQASDTLIHSADDGLNLLGNLYYQGFDKVIISQHTLTPVFFDLQNGIAGEILQKFSTYGVRLAIVGDFSDYTGKSIKAFMYESNKMKQINFVPSLTEALAVLASK